MRKEAILAKMKKNKRKEPKELPPAQRAEAVISQLPTISVDSRLHGTISSLTAAKPATNQVSAGGEKPERKSRSELTSQRATGGHVRKATIPLPRANDT